MKTLGLVLGAAVVVTIAGCKDPDFDRGNGGSANKVKQVPASATQPARSNYEADGARSTVSPAGDATDIHAPDSDLVVVHVKPTTSKVTVDMSKRNAAGRPAVPQPSEGLVVSDIPADTSAASGAGTAAAAGAAAGAAASTVVYTVQNGDLISKISKKFNVKIEEIKRLNPKLDVNKVRVGQKINLPGELAGHPGLTAPAAATASSRLLPASSATAFKPYEGAVKQYAVKSGDTLGKIAHDNGITIRQLKELNGLSSDFVRVGKTLKVPAVAPAASAAAQKTKVPAVAEAKPVAAAKDPVKEAVKEAETKADKAQGDAEAAVSETMTQLDDTAANAAAAEPDAATYVVREGDDVIGVSIRWGVSAAAIRELNNLGDNDKLVPGTVIKLPADAQQ